MRLVSVVNQKGGVGKTTTVANLSHMLALSGKKVAAIDFDPQGSLTVSLGENSRSLADIDEVLIADADIYDVMHEVRDNLKLVACGPQLATCEQKLKITSDVAKRLRNTLKSLEGFDYVLLDCPPSSGFLVVSALFATEEILIPVASAYLALHGMSHLMGTLAQFERLLKLKHKQWIVVTRFHPRRRLSQGVIDNLVEHFPGSVLKTPIRETSALAEGPSFGLTISEYRNKSYGSADYEKLASDFCKGRTIQ